MGSLISSAALLVAVGGQGTISRVLPTVVDARVEVERSGVGCCFSARSRTTFECRRDGASGPSIDIPVTPVDPKPRRSPP